MNMCVQQIAIVQLVLLILIHLEREILHIFIKYYLY